MAESGRIKAELSTSTKGGSVLNDENGFEYLKNKEVGNRSFWKCREKRSKSCPATASTVIINNEIFIDSVRNEHTHSSNLLKKRVKKLETEAVENGSKNVSLAPRKILADLTKDVQNVSYAASTSLTSQKCLMQKIYRSRRKNLGELNLPKSAEDLLNLPEK